MFEHGFARKEETRILTRSRAMQARLLAVARCDADETRKHSKTKAPIVGMFGVLDKCLLLAINPPLAVMELCFSFRACPSEFVYGEVLLYRLLAWLKGLRWPDQKSEQPEQQVSMFELLLDFECATGTTVPVNLHNAG